MLVVRHIRFMIEPIRFVAFGLHIKDTDAVDYLVDCVVIAAREAAKGENLIFLLLEDFVLA